MFFWSWLVQHAASVLERLQVLGAGRFELHGPVGALEALRFCAVTAPIAALVHMMLRDVTGPELCKLLRGRPGTRGLPILLFDSRQ